MKTIFSCRAFYGALARGALPAPHSLRCQYTLNSQPNILRHYAVDASRAARDTAQTARDSSRSKRLLYTVGGLVVVGAGAIAVSDEATHLYEAARRTGRVVTALFVNINEYVVWLVLPYYLLMSKQLPGHFEPQA